jgi:hypothetical protein
MKITVYPILYRLWKVMSSEIIISVESVVLTVVVRRSSIFWDIMPCSMKKATCFLDLRGQKEAKQETSMLQSPEFCQAR